MVACFPRGKLLLFSVYVNSSQLTTRVEYFAIIRSRLIAECFVFIFYFNATAADMKKFRVSAYRQINTVETTQKGKQVALLHYWQLLFMQALLFCQRLALCNFNNTHTHNTMAFIGPERRKTLCLLPWCWLD